MGTNMMKNKKILITGSNGLLGQKLVALISKEEGIELIATARGENRLPEGRYRYIAMDITNKDQVAGVISSEKPDVVINTAAMTNVDQCELNKEEAYKSNVTAVENIIEACEAVNSFLVHVSTDFIFKGDQGPLTEEAVPDPVNYYGQTKLLAEQKIFESKVSWAIARTVLVYGIAHDLSRGNIVLWVKNSLESGKSIQVVNDQYRTPTLAEDLAQGCWLLARKEAEGLFNISGGDMLTPYDIAIKTADAFQLNKSLISSTDSSKFKQPAKRPLKTGFIIEKARNALGYKPHTFDEGLCVLKRQLSEAGD
jgi:dTDP-4-dehydrorhamnose reductase